MSWKAVCVSNYDRAIYKGAVHKRRRQLGGEEGSKIGQNCRQRVLKYCQYGGGGCQKFRKIADVVYEWSLTGKNCISEDYIDANQFSCIEYF